MHSESVVHNNLAVKGAYGYLVARLHVNMALSRISHELSAIFVLICVALQPCSMSLLDGVARWPCSMALLDGAARWHCSLALLAGIARWRCRLSLLASLYAQFAWPLVVYYSDTV